MNSDMKSQNDRFGGGILYLRLFTTHGSQVRNFQMT